jgi:hypothetical protein
LVFIGVVIPIRFDFYPSAPKTLGKAAVVEGAHAGSYGSGTTMTKKDFAALAEALRINNRTANGRTEFTPDHLRVLADFCASQDPNFNPKRWIDYIAGECGQAAELIFVEGGGTHVPDPRHRNK